MSSDDSDPDVALDDIAGLSDSDLDKDDLSSPSPEQVLLPSVLCLFALQAAGHAVHSAALADNGTSIYLNK